MANALYNKAKQRLLEGGFDLANDDIRVLLVDAADYTPDLATHEFLSDIPVAARLGNGGGTGRTDGPLLTGKTVTDGVFNADDTTITGAEGDESEYLLLYKDDGLADESSPLIALYDTGNNLPITPNGGDLVIEWDEGANKVFRL